MKINSKYKLVYFMAQLLFWAFSSAVSYRLFTENYDNGALDIAYVALFHLSLVFVFYSAEWNARWLLRKKKIAWFALTCIVVMGVGVFLHVFTFGFLSDIIFPNYYLASYYTWTELIEIHIVYMFFGVTIYLALHFFQEREKSYLLETENQQVKIDSLKSQINPHFLFNSLNNIYSMISKENLPAKQYLLKLSDSLRYMIYETDEELVPLENEIEYLVNYVELEKLRFEDPQSITLQIDGNFEGRLIAPLLLIVLVENCFKHFDRENPLIDIHISITDLNLLLKTKNTKNTAPNSVAGGFGLKNLESRLEALYPDRHDLSFQLENELFTTRLSLEI